MKIIFVSKIGGKYAGPWLPLGKKSPCMGRTLDGVFQAKNRQNLA